jgi:hypothetical protein
MGLLEFISSLLVDKREATVYTSDYSKAKGCFAVANRLFDRDTNGYARDELAPVITL